MRLLLDLGNSRLKWAAVTEDCRLESGAIDYRQLDPLAALEQALSSLDQVPEAVACSSVGQATLENKLAQWAQRHFGLPMVLATSQAHFGSLRNGYCEAQQMGVDRWLAMIGAWQHVRQAACVIDAGTACTVDLIDGTGQHLGGWIAPSERLMVGALHQNTERIAATNHAAVGWGRTTSEAVSAGVAACWRGLLQGVQQAIRSTLPSAKLLITGGNVDSLREVLPGALHRPHLVLEGLDLWLAEQPSSSTAP